MKTVENMSLYVLVYTTSTVLAIPIHWKHSTKAFMHPLPHNNLIIHPNKQDQTEVD